MTRSAAAGRRRALAGMVLAGFAGTKAEPEAAALVRQGVAGVMLSRRNVGSSPQLRALVGELRGLSAQTLLVAIDQEPGRVARAAHVLGRTPSARALGALGDEEIRRYAREIGVGLAAHGVDMDLAPVLDVTGAAAGGVIGDRSFGADPARVASAGVAFIEGLGAAGVHAVGKHFPGHGGTGTDSHDELPVLREGVARLRSRDLVPFEAAVRAACPAVMIGHLLVPEIDDRLPASLSPEVVRELLRDELGFAGVAMTDALEMGAVARTWELPVGVELAVRAGVDLVIVGRSPQRLPEILDALEEAVDARRLPWRRVEDALARIAALRDGGRIRSG